MAILIGTDLNEVVLPGTISPSVDTVIGNPDLSEPDGIYMAGGNDIVQGDEGDDIAFLGAGDDNDMVEGQQGTDTLEFNGANVADTVDISAVGERARFFREPATVTIDMDRVERIEFNALGGVDQIVVNDLTGTDVGLVDLDLAGVIGSGIGDAAIDNVTVRGTEGRDLISVRTLGGSTVVGGLAARVEIAGEDAGQDVLTIRAGDGNDRISAALLTDDGMKLVVFGEAGNDRIRGGAGDDDLFGGRGHDQIFGARGNDELTGNSGRDLYIFAGQNGTDTITDFRDGVDKIDIRGYGSALNSFADLAGDIVQVGNDVRINLGANVNGAGRIVIEDFTVGQVSAADFQF